MQAKKSSEPVAVWLDAVGQPARLVFHGARFRVIDTPTPLPRQPEWPSGITHPGKTCVIGNGVVVSPQALLNEVDGLRAQGVEVDHRNLLISNRAHLILPYHVALDRAIEASRGNSCPGFASTVCATS